MTVRHHGDPAAEYRAATEGVALFERADRPLLSIAGKAPAAMLSGVVSGRIPEARTPADGWRRTEAAYSTVLTPKGRIISDLTLLRLPGAAEAFWVDVPAGGVAALGAYFAKVLPPRMARVAHVEGAARWAVVGPTAAAVLAETLSVPVEVLAGLTERDALFDCDAEGAARVCLFRPSDLGEAGFDVVVRSGDLEGLQQRLRDVGAVPAGAGTWETLRVEAGRPRFGVDMDERTIPIEAGLGERAIDHTKGCYTGQEVIVRIRDRGHVNRHLRQLLLGEAPSPTPGTPLFTFDDEKPVGEITSAVSSPRFGQTLALGYVRREVEPGQAVRVGAPDGAEAVVVG